MSLCDKTIKYISKYCNCDLNLKTVLITGANSGIGFKTAETVIYKGASVIMACRNLEKANAARIMLLKDYPNADIRIVKLDLSDFDSIDEFCDNLPDIDVFVNNAGLFQHPGQKTKQGFEMVIGTNYIGLYYLSEKVLPKLRKLNHDVVYINTISIIHKIAKVDFDNFFDDKKSYSRSKLCIARYTNYLVQKYKGTNISIYMNHPGMAITPIANHILGNIYKFAKYFPINTAEKSSLSVLWILSNKPKVGCIVGPNKGFGGWGYPMINKSVKRASRDIDKLIAFTQNEIDKGLNGFYGKE